MARNRNYQIDKVWKFAKQSKLDLKVAGFSDIFLRLLQIRGISSVVGVSRFTEPDYKLLSDPYLIPDMEKAVNRILVAAQEKERIAVYGDYDVDGVTATAVLATFLETIGVDFVTYIPSRMDEGYGLNKEAIDKLLAKKVNLIITVDCGSVSHEEVDYAKALGIDIVVTDHHVLKEVNGELAIPSAVAVINPKRLGPESPLYELAGVAVAFYLVRALQSHFGEKLPLGQEKWFLDLVALGTICDIVPLSVENRLLAGYGLKVLGKTKRVGIQALAEVCDVSLDAIDSYKVGFLLGPRLNASGRLEHAEASLSLLLAKDKEKALLMAVDLDKLNTERQELTEKIVNEARELIEKDGSDKKLYLLANEHWPAGVVGIVASRLVEEYRRPMLIAEKQGEIIKGSARSIDSFNIIEALSAIGTHFDHFGGHAFAAGFSLMADKFILVNDELLKIADKKIEKIQIAPEIELDTAVLCKDITQEFVTELSLLEPYGRANKKPVFGIMRAKIVDYRLVGNPAVHLKLSIEQDGYSLSGIAFGYGETAEFDIHKEYDLAVTLEINEWNNHKIPEFRLIDIRLSKG